MEDLPGGKRPEEGIPGRGTPLVAEEGGGQDVVEDGGAAGNIEITPEEQELNKQAFDEAQRQNQELGGKLVFSARSPNGEILIFNAIGEFPGAGEDNAYAAGVHSELGPVVINRILAQELEKTPDDYQAARDSATNKSRDGRLPFEVIPVRDVLLSCWKQRVDVSRTVAERFVAENKAAVEAKRNALDYLTSLGSAGSTEAPTAAPPPPAAPEG